MALSTIICLILSLFTFKAGPLTFETPWMVLIHLGKSMAWSTPISAVKNRWGHAAKLIFCLDVQVVCYLAVLSALQCTGKMGVAVSLLSHGTDTAVVNFSDHCNRCLVSGQIQILGGEVEILGMAEFEGIDCSHLGEEWPKFPLLRFPTLEQTVGGTNRAELFEADIRGGNFDKLSGICRL